MDFLGLYVVALGVILLSVTLVWLVSLRLKDSSIVDIFWGLGFVIVVWVTFALAGGNAENTRGLLTAVLVTLWGTRLSLHIGVRNWGKGEDFRYAKWRAENGASWWWYSFFKVFLLQGLIMWVVSAPVISVQLLPQSSLTWLDAIGVVVWGIGFFFEAVGDWQLRQFKRNPSNKGKVMNIGLWHYTRHPNYFGDATQWWGFFLIAISGGGWATVFSPLLMNYLLLRVSGVAMLERSMKETKPEYADYVRRTSAFFPMLPKRD